MKGDFGTLLRRARVAAEYSQERLAELAGLSAVAISGYERGLRSVPRRETVASLAEALRLQGAELAEFEASAVRKPDHNLPWQATSFVGRQREVEDVAQMLAPRGVVTMTGAGGIGKTRVAIEVASRMPQKPRDGIWFLDLAPLADGAFVVNSIASAFDLQLVGEHDLLASVVRAIKARESLLIFDNCEHVLEDVRHVAGTITAGCPHISILATSRERLGVVGERVYRLSTLSVPSKAETSVEEGREYEALTLFAERAATAQYPITMMGTQADIAADICRRLDGNALAIELAAARLPVLGLTELQAQLARAFRVVGGGHHLPARQRTLHAAISWSHDLLDDAERILFRRLAIFARGWTLDAAEEVCGFAGLDRTAIVSVLISLAEKSLVVVDLGADPPRYSFSESTRAYALEKLAAGEGHAISRHHAQWMATFADRLYEALLIEPRHHWESALAPEFDNALAALEWSLGPDGDALLAARIASGLQGYWISAGLGEVGLRYINTAVDRIRETADTSLLARTLIAQSLFSHGAKRLEEQQRVIAMLEKSHDQRLLARCFSLLTYSLAQVGAYDDAIEASNRSWTLVHEAGLQRSSLYLGILGTRSRLFRRQGRLDEALAAATESLLLAQAIDDRWWIPRCQAMVADIEFAAGETHRAIALAKEALDSPHAIRGGYDEVYGICNLACYELAIGDIDPAEAHAREALELARTANEFILHVSIQHLATVAAMRKQSALAARLLGYVNAWYERVGYQRDPTDQKGFDVLMASLNAQLTPEKIAELEAQGALLTRDAAVDYASKGDALVGNSPKI